MVVRTPVAVRYGVPLGLVIEFVGFLYDDAWHAQHLSLEAIPPGELATVHSGIFVGQALVLVVALYGLARRVAGRLGLATIVVGAITQVVGDATDMWAHAHGYERDLYHALIYAGAGLTLGGYLVTEVWRLLRRGPESTEDDASEPTRHVETV